MNVYERLKERLRTVSRDAFAKALGYGSVRRAGKTLDAFVSSESLEAWLEDSYYDFNHTSKTFFLEACTFCGFDCRECDTEFQEALRRIERLHAAAVPWIFVETGFRRKSEPIHALALLEQTRRIALDKKEIVDLSPDRALEKVSEIVRSHYVEKEGRLPVWGEIAFYVYHHTDGRTFRFSPDGTVTETDGLAQETPPARLLLGNKSLITEVPQ